MLLPRRILPSDTLENGFRVAHNETVDAMPDYSQCQVTDTGLLQFYNDLGEFIGEVDLSTVFRLQSDASDSGAVPQFYSASETQEGVGKIATAEAVAAGDNQYDWVTPATLEYAFGLLKDELGLGAGNKTLDELAEATPQLQQDIVDADRVAVIEDGKLRAMSFGRLVVGKLLPLITWEKLLLTNPASSAAPYLTGKASYLGLRDLNDPNPFGLVLVTKQPNGSTTAANYLTWNQQRQLEIAAGDALNAVLSPSRNEWRTDESFFTGRVVADNIRVANPELAEAIDYLFVGNRRDGDGRMLDASNTMHQQIVSMTTLVRAIINHPVFVASFGQPTTADPISRTILCYDKYDTQSGALTLSPAKIGTPQPHTLHLPAGQIFGRVSYPDGQLASGYALSYPDLDHYQLDYAGTSGETSDLIIELYKRVS